MTSRSTKTTWELAGRVSGSFTQSTKKAQNQLGQLRREYRQNEQELKRMQSVMRNAAVGTNAYSNASRRVPELQQQLSAQAFAISDVEKESLSLARTQGRMASASGRAGAGLKALATFGLAAGAGIGIAGGAVALLSKSLSTAGQEAQALQTLSVRGVDTYAYQRAASAMGVLTGNTQAAKAAMLSAADSAHTIAQNLQADPASITTDQHRAAPMLGFEDIRDFSESRNDVEGMIKTISDQWKRSNENQRLDIYWAAGQLQIQRSVIDAIAEQNDLYKERAALLKQVNAGNKGAVGDLEKVDAQIGRINSGLGVMTHEQIAAAERADESLQILSQFKKDLRTAAAVATVDAYDFLRNPVGEYRKGSEREGLRSPLAELGGLSPAGAKDAYQAALDRSSMLGGGFGDFQNPRREVREGKRSPLEELGGLSLGGAKDAYRAAAESAQPSPIAGGFGSYAQGGVVPGPEGRPQLAMVHGGRKGSVHQRPARVRPGGEGPFPPDGRVA